ncbi:MAG: DUF1844 domain-containing protein [Thermodesulfatator sp.]|nr:MAG: DUF1844 domain-containing protein [Thermodesulfatator sp.]
MEKTVNENQAKKDETQEIPLPEVTFATFILSLNTSALMHLGEIPGPDNQKQECDLQLARHAIDTIAMLKEKTQGNLSEDEQALMDNILFDLRMRFVKKST